MLLHHLLDELLQVGIACKITAEMFGMVATDALARGRPGCWLGLTDRSARGRTAGRAGLTYRWPTAGREEKGAQRSATRAIEQATERKGTMRRANWHLRMRDRQGAVIVGSGAHGSEGKKFGTRLGCIKGWAIPDISRGTRPSSRKFYPTCRRNQRVLGDMPGIPGDLGAIARLARLTFGIHPNGSPS